MFSLLLSPMVRTFAAACSKPTFLGILKPWYEYLNLQSEHITGSNGKAIVNCKITNFSNDSTAVLGGHSPFLLIALAILDDLIRVAALVAVGYVIYGGIQYTTSQGSPDATKRAQQTIINALIGVVLATLAASIVAFIGNRLGG